MTMILKIHDYKENVLTPVHHDYDGEKLDLEFVDLHYLKKISLSGAVCKTERTIQLEGSLETEIEQTCGRCLGPVVSPVHVPFDLMYEIRGREVVDTTEDLRDLLILSHPQQFLCREDCPGICQGCGKNLNHESCICK